MSSLIDWKKRERKSEWWRRLYKLKKSKKMKFHVITLTAIVALANAGNPFTSDVIELTASNWKKEVMDSPHAYFVNFCREGW